MNAVAKISTKIRKGDEVRVMVGRSKGVVGKVESLDFKNNRVMVAGANIFKKHTKPSQDNPDGGIIEKPKSLHLSNVMLVDPKSQKGTRLGFKITDGKKARFAKASGETL